jgi:hypothetical protein
MKTIIAILSLVFGSKIVCAAETNLTLPSEERLCGIETNNRLSEAADKLEKALNKLPCLETGTTDACENANNDKWLEDSDTKSLRDLVDSSPNAAYIHKAARRRQLKGLYDDALTLFQEAGERGDVKSLTEQARLYSPICFVSGRPFSKPNAYKAAQLYREAANKGDLNAEEALASLKAWLEDQSKNDIDAQKALKEFWKN